MYSKEEVCKRSESGAKLLDEKYPGWAPKINVPTLDMKYPDRCILGQLYEEVELPERLLFAFANQYGNHGFGKGRRILFETLDRKPVEQYGFDTSEEDDGNQYAYQWLRECWIEQIHARIILTEVKSNG